MPTQQVVVEFIGDYSKLQTANAELQKSGNISGQVDQFNQLNKSADAAAGNVSKIGGASKEAGTQLERMANAANNASKGIVGAAGKQAIDAVRTAALGATAEIVKLGASLDQAKAKLAALEPNTDAFKALEEEIKATEIAMATFGKTTEQVQAGTASIRQETVAYTNTLVRLKQAGLDNTDVYRALKEASGELGLSVKKVGEELGGVALEQKNLHGGIEIAEGIAASFETAASASALFGEKSEDLEKSMQKVFAAMALANGIQKLYTITSKESAAVQAVARGQAALQAVATRLATAAESEYVVVRIVATAAQSVLNAVMAANPVVLLIGGLIAAGAALVAFTSNSDKAAEKEKQLNEEMKLSIEYLELYAKNSTAGQQERLNDLQAELTVLKAKNVSQSQILEKEKEISEQERAIAGRNHGFYAQEIHDIGDLKAQQESLQNKLKQFQAELDNKQSGNFFTRWIYGERSGDDINKDIENTKAKIENTQKSIELGEAAQNAAQQKIAEDQAKAEEIRKHNVELQLKDQVAIGEATLARTKSTTQDELNAQIGLIERKQALELNDANLTADQRLAIAETNARQIRDLQYNYSLSRAKEDLSIYQVYADGKLKTVSAGSDEELEIEKQLLIQKRAVDTLAARDNIREVQRVRLQFENDYTALLKRFAKQRQLDAIETEKFTNQARLDVVQAGTHEEYELKLQAVAIEQKAELAAIDDRVRNTAKGQAQIAEINAKALGQQEQLRKQYLLQEINDETNVSKTVNDIRITRLQNQANNPNTGSNQQFNLQQQARKIELENIQIEIRANERLYRNKLETQEEYIQKSLDLENQRLQKQGEIDNADADHRKKLYQEIETVSLDISQKISDATFAINDNGIKNQENRSLAALERDKAATLNQKFLTNQQKAAIEESFRRQQIAIERAAAIKKRDNDVHQAEVDGFLAVAKVWAENAGYPILAAVLSALAIANTLAQVSKIKSTPLPTYATGVEMLDGPGGPTSDSILARLSRGERVVPAEINKRYFPALSAIHNQTVPANVANEMLTGALAPTIDLDNLEAQRWYNGNAIDYDRLGEAVARHMAPQLGDLPQNHFSFDEKGFIHSVQKGLERQVYLNKRYSFRK